MYDYDQIRSIHLELTSKCQARCPMCPRRINGGPINPLVTLNEITLDQFKKWFSEKFVQQLENVILCGNLGDPIVAEDTLEIIKYLRSVNSRIEIIMHTNGSARTSEWWEELARQDVRVTFGIDGLEDTHHLYRIGTDWNRIIKNARAFINSGGKANWHMLVFKHNEHQVNACKDLSLELGFSNFSIKHTSRFKDDSWIVIDDDGVPIYKLEPTSKSKNMIPLVYEAPSTPSTINCKAKKQSQLYVGSNGMVVPCCWIDLSWVLPSHESRIDYMGKIKTFPNLNNNNLKDIVESGYFDNIENTWNNDPLRECSKQCGVFDKLGAQFV